jgi:hypothetical protein
MILALCRLPADETEFNKPALPTQARNRATRVHAARESGSNGSVTFEVCQRLHEPRVRRRMPLKTDLREGLHSSYEQWGSAR